jgi:phytoene dehydrogenase-like protein
LTPPRLPRYIPRSQDRSTARSQKWPRKSSSSAPASPAFDKLSFREALSLLAALPAALPILTKWTKVPLQGLVDGLKSERLRGAFSILFGDALRDFPTGAFFMMLGFMAKKSAGYPLGGSLAFARAIEAKYLSLGGKIRYRAKVDRIILEGPSGAGRAVGLAHDCAALPHMQAFDLKAPLVLEAGALVQKRLSLRIFNFDPSLAPAGKTAATVMIETFNDGYWTELAARDSAAYAAEKKAVADAVVAAIDTRIPGFASWVEVVDVATPKTFIRYTNNWHGSYEGWLPTSSSFMKKVPKTIPGIAGFHMVGQWVNPGGGLPPCGMDGRKLAKKLCKAEGRRFRPD